MTGAKINWTNNTTNIDQLKICRLQGHKELGLGIFSEILRATLVTGGVDGEGLKMFIIFSLRLKK